MVGSFFSQILEKVTGYFVRSERYVLKETTSRNTTLHQCAVCETPYTFGGPDPYLLPCLHSVCQTCQDADNTDTIRCGICQEDFKRNDVGETKDVVTTKQVLLSTTQNDAGAVLCTNNNDGIQAMSWNTLKEGIQHVSERLSLVKDLEGKVDGLELDIECNAQDLKEEIKHTFGQLRSVLDQRENEVLLELEKCKEAEKASNASPLKLLQHEDSSCETLLHFIQSCLELCCPTEVLSLKKKIEAKIIANSATQLPQRIRQKSSITFSQTGLQPLTESMATFGETCTVYYTSGVEFLYVEEATEEQKARARKYLLPESFYLYENKPPCPGCIGCEDYDPSKVSVPSKVKAKSKSEETSPAPTIASVQVSSSAGSVEFLYVEEATEEQKARARKYLLPESFYLYENKPPCPGCIGCEDYDPSKVSVPSKVKAKSKSEETSPAPTIASVQVSSSAGNTSGVEFLYVEEATEEQKARARKYLLPESFYLYENKPPCPGCIGCEDYDPSKVSVPSKVKAKSKSEETSPAPTIASVQVSSSAGSSTGASEGFCMFGQASGMSFSTLAAQGDAVGYAFKKDENRPFQWSGAGQQIFGTSPGGNRTNVDDDEVVQSDDIDFKPIIDLPELVEVKTGEEGWEVVYCQRSKLFRFVRDSNQWKERAVGDMKILKQDTESGISDKYRLLMRRDQVHKVACNHLIAGNMTLSPMSTSETAWCWTAQDYAENEAKVEQFALRFKTEELARQFKKKFEEVQELVRARESAKNTNNSAIVSKSQDVPVTEEKEEEDDDSEEESIMFEKRATSTYFENDEWKAGRHIRPSPEHMDAKIRSLAYSQESLVKIVLARNEELVKSNSQLVGALRETREVITHLKSQLNLSQKYNYFSLSTPGPHMASPHHPPYPPPQGMAPPQFGYQMPSPAGLPGYRPPSPRTRCRTNLMGHTGFMGKDESNVVGNDDDENPYFIDGEFFKEVKQYYVPDSHLEWPYGNRAGIEGSSTVTYAPQNRHQKPQS